MRQVTEPPIVTGKATLAMAHQLYHIPNPDDRHVPLLGLFFAGPSQILGRACLFGRFRSAVTRSVSCRLARPGWIGDNSNPESVENGFCR